MLSRLLDGGCDVNAMTKNVQLYDNAISGFLPSQLGQLTAMAQALQLHELSVAQLKQLISRLGGEEAVPELVIEKRELVGLATQLLSQVLTLACA